MKALMTIVDAMQNKNLFAPAFKSSSWRNWKTFLKSVFALPLDADELKAFQHFTGRNNPTSKQPREVFVAAGMGGGKTRIMSTVAVYLSAFRDYTKILAPGQRAYVYMIAVDKAQAAEAFNYAEGLFDSIKPLAALVSRKKGYCIHLKNRVTLEVRAANFRTVRGRTLAAVIADEVAFWRSEGSLNPDKEILDALRPGLGRVPNSLLLAISSPHSKRGELWNQYKRHYGQDSTNVLFWKASTLEMNPAYDPVVIKEKYEEDPSQAAAQYGGEFRSDLESFIQAEVVESLVIKSRYELPPLSGISYVAFFDGSGGMQDSFGLGIGHAEKDISVLDLLREVRPPCNTESVIQEFAKILKQYRIHQVVGDKYAGATFAQMFQKFGINYRFSELDKSAIYRNLLPLLNSGIVELLDNKRLVVQLCGLERKIRTGSGRDTIDHPVNSKDDLANVCAGSIVLAASKLGESLDWITETKKVYHGRKRPFSGWTSQVVHTECGLERVGTQRPFGNFSLRIGNKKY